MVRTVYFLSGIISSQAILDCIFYILIKIKKKKEKKKSLTSSEIEAFLLCWNLLLLFWFHLCGIFVFVVLHSHQVSQSTVFYC